MPSLLVIQWGIVGFFVAIHFIFGFLRGSSKSTYFSIVSIVTTFISLWLVSLLSFNLIFSESFTLTSAIEMVTGMIGFAIPAEFLVYVEDPQIVAIVFAFADLVLRIIGFITLYPIIKFFITLIVFKPIWKHGIKKNLLKKQNDKALAKFEESPHGKKKFVPSKKLQKNFLGRFFGAFMGGIRGFVMAFVFLLPILVIAGFLADVPDVVTIRVFSNEETLSTGDSTDLIALPPIVEDYLAQIKEMNESGLGAITRQIVINGKPVDRLIFDMIFTTQVIVEDEEPLEINFVQELGNIVGIAKVLLDGGYLEDDFDFTTISTDNLEDIEAIFTYLGQSDMVGLIVPFGTKYAVNNLLPDMINGVNLYDREYSAAALNQFTSMSWEEEFGNFYGIIEAVLEFGSVSELMTYASNPELIAELTPEQGEKLANVIRAVGDLQFYALISAGADLATVLPQVQSLITWLDPSEVEGYLQERLSFIIQNPDFFRGEEGEISRLADLVEFMFEDEELLPQLFAATQEGATPDQIIEAINGQWVGALLQRVVDLELLMNLIPFGVDYGLYSAAGELVEQDVADRIAERLEEVSWEDEILNIGDIYAEVFELGIAALLGTDPDYVAFADDVLVNHMTEIRAIVSKIFEESEVVNAAIEIATPIAIDRFIADDELKSLVNDALISDPITGIVDFSFGQEINSILTMIESVYTFTSIGELQNVSTMTPEQQLDLMSRFGSMSDTEYAIFTDAIESLQVLQRVGEAGLEYVRNSQGIEQLYVPSGVQLGDEITSIIGIAYYAAKYVYDNRLIYDSYEEIDFAPLFADEVFRSHILKTDLDNHSNLLLTNIAHNIKLYSTDPSVGGYIGVPQVLLDADNDSDLWMTEINALFGAVLDLVASFEDSTALTLSARGVLPLTEDPMLASVEIFTQYANLSQAELAFGSLDSSMIFRSSVVKAASSFGSVTESILNGYAIGIPEMAKDGDMLLQGTFVELIHGLATLADDMNQTLGFDTAGDLANGAGVGALIEAYNQVSDQTLETFAEIKLIRGVFSELILSPLVQEYVRELVGGTGLVQVSDDFFAFNRVDNEISVEDFQELFIAIRGFGITEALINDPAGQVFSHLRTLDDTKLSDIFDGTIIKEIFTFALTDPVLLNSIADIVTAAYQGVQAGVTQLGQVNPNFLAIVSGLGTYQDVDGLFDTNEFKAFIRTFNSLNLNSMEELNSLGDLSVIHQKLNDQPVIDTLFESNWLYDNVNYVFTNTDLQDQLADILEGQVLSQVGITVDITRDAVSFSLPKYDLIETAGPRIGGIKVSEIERFILAATRINWLGEELGAGTAIASNASSLLMSTGTDSILHIDYILESKLLMAIFDKVLNFEHNGLNLDEIAITYANNLLSANPTFAGISLSKELLHYDERALDANLVLTKAEIKELVEAISYIDLSTTIGLPTFYQLIDVGSFDQIFDSYIIHSLLSNALTSVDVQTFGVNKINELQAIVVLDNSFLAIDPILMDGDLFKQEEFENIFIALRALGLSDSASFSTIGLATFSELQGRNIDLGTGKDDFDRVFDANFMYIILDRALKLTSLGDYVGSTLGTALGVTINTFDTTPPAAMLGQVGDPEVEVGRIPKAEFRRLFDSFGLLGDISSIGLSTFLNLIDPTIDPLTEDDDFETFIASDFIYIILGRLLNVTEFGDYVGELLSGAFGDDPIALDMTPPSDAKGQVVGDIEEGLMTRFELRQLMVSFKMLGLENGTDIDVSTILGMIGANEDLSGDDDFDRFLTSLYIQDKISILLLADPIIELIANGRFLPEDFVLPAGATVNVDGRDRMTKQEIYNLFNGLTVLGLSDLEGANLGLDTITALDDTEISEVLESSYLYVVIDLMLKSETQLVLPPDAFEDAGIYDGMVKKTEILNVLNAFEILGSSNPGDIDPNNISLDDIEDLLDLNSAIIDQLLSDAIVEALTGNPLNSINSDIQLNQGSSASTELAVITEVPSEALNLPGTRLLRLEMYALIEALRAMNITDLNANIDVDTVTLEQLKDVHYLGLGTDPMGDAFESYLLHRLLSESIAGAVTVPDAALMNAVDLYPNEISALIAALEVMNLSSLADPIDVDAITLTQLQDLHYLGLGTDPMGDLYESYVIHRLISTSVIGAVTVPNDALMVGSTEDVKPDEISALIAALGVMNLTTLSDPIDVDAITLLQLEEIHYLGLGIDPMGDDYESYTIHRLISTSVIGAVTVPDDAFMVGSTEDVKPLEISALIAALGVMNLTTLSDPIDVNTITTTQLQNIHYLGLGIDPMGDDYESLVIHRLISDAVIGAVTVPDDAMMGLDDVEPLEISALILALSEMGLNTLGDPIDVNTITINQLRNIHYLGLGTDPLGDDYESLIIHRLISDAVIPAVEVPSDAMVEGSLTDVKPNEVSALIEALAEMGLNTLGDPIDVNTITITQLRNIHYLGLGIDPVADDYESLIIHRLISDAVIGAVTVPDDAMMDLEDVEPLEISALIEALAEMGLNTLGDPIDVNAITLVQLENIHYLGLGIDPIDDEYESLIIHRLISDAVVGAVTVPDDAMIAGSATDVEPLEISALIAALGEMGLNTLGDPIDVNTITLVQLENIHYLGLGIDPTGDEYESLIIHRLISDAVVGAVEVPDDAMIAGSATDVEPLEISALIAALDEMGLNTLGDPIDVNTITLVQLENIHYLGLGIDPVLDEYESFIIHRLISDAVIAAVEVPDDAMMDLEDVEPLEISALIAALDEMGLNTLGDPIDVNTITLVQLQNIHYLGLGIDPVDDEYESLIIHRLISDAVIGAVEVPDDAMMGLEDVEPLEISALILALDEMGLATLGDPIDVNVITLVQLQNIHYLGLGTDPVVDEYESLILHRLISDAVIAAVEVPDDAYMVGSLEDVKADEISALILALDEMGLATLGDPIDVNVITLAQLRGVHYLGLGTDPVDDDYESLILHRLISDAVIGVVDVPDDAYMVGSLEDVKADEISALIDALEVMGLATLGDPIDVAGIKISELQDIHYLGLGTDPVLDEYESLIIHRLISDAVTTALETPSGAYMVGSAVDLLAAEVQGVIDALLLLAGGDDTETMSGLTPVNNNVLTPALIEDLLDLDALIIYRLIASGIISATLATDESLAEVGDDNYDASDIGADVKIAEMYALVEAMNIMGIANLSVSIDATTVTISDLQDLHYVGLGIDPVTDTYQSRIVHRILSDAITSALDDPSTAYMVGSSEDLLAAEIQGVIDAMLELGAPTSTLTGLTPIDNNALTATVLQNLIDINTRIVDRLIADGIIASGVATTPSYAVFGDVNYDPTAVNEDIKRTEMQHVVDSMDILGVTSILTIASDITLAKLQALTPAEIEILVEAGTDGPNTIIYYIISETVDPSNNIYDTLVILDPINYPGPADNYYVLDGLNNRIRLKRTAIEGAI